MKLMHTTTTTLNTKEFNKVSERIIDALYALNTDLRDLYDIHVNYINDSWQIDFIPVDNLLPVLKVDTYTDNVPSGAEVLKITPANITDMPKSIKLKDDDKSYALCMNYAAVFDFVLSLYDFEYRF